MTPEKLYEKGYADGSHGLASNASFAHDENYAMGYEDGRGDRESGTKATGTKSPFIADDNKYLEAPKGYLFTGEHRTPLKGEIYLTKAGNAGVAKSDPKNGRQRHMLVADDPCFRGTCGFMRGHSGRCSHHMVN
jgi:hypothetical protein